MKTIEFNIGLSSNPLSMEQVGEQLFNHPITDKFIFGKRVDGSWDDEVEPTAYVKIQTGIKRLSTVIGWVEDLCVMMEQECIAITVDGIGYLVYDYRSDKRRDPFVERYFVTP